MKDPYPVGPADLHWNEWDVAHEPAFDPATRQAVSEGLRTITDGKVLARAITAWAAVLTNIDDVRLTLRLVRRFVGRHAREPFPPIQIALGLTATTAGSLAIRASATELALVAILLGHRPKMGVMVRPEDAVQATARAVHAAATRAAESARIDSKRPPYWPLARDRAKSAARK